MSLTQFVRSPLRGLIAAATLAALLVVPYAAGVRLPVFATGGDTCGYPDLSSTLSSTSFNESTVTRAVEVSRSAGYIAVFANDESSMLLGVDGAAAFQSAGATTLTSPINANQTYVSLQVQALQAPVSPGDKIVIGPNGARQSVNATASGPSAAGDTSIAVRPFHSGSAFASGTAVADANVAYGHASNPSLGTTGLDPSNRPQYAALFITDLTGNPGSRSGDWQQGGSPANAPFGTPFVDDVFGTWATATTSGGYTVTRPTIKNNWSLGPGSDVPSAGFNSLGNEGFGTEVRWSLSHLGLQAGHRYRIQVMTHDGDQNKSGGDVGEYCTTLAVPVSPSIETFPPGEHPPFLFRVQSPVGSTIQDTAVVHDSGLGTPTGSVTFHLYFVPEDFDQTNAGANDCSGQAADHSTLIFTDTKDLNGGQATSDPYTDPDTAMGMYFWQTTYSPVDTHGNVDPNYLASTEVCGRETVDLLDARMLLSPPEATNVVGLNHTLTATLQFSEDDSAWYGGQLNPTQQTTINFSFSGNPSPQAQFVGGNSSCMADPDSGSCSVQITDTTAETLQVHAQAQNVNFGGTIGNFPVIQTDGSKAGQACGASPGDADNCTGDAIKHYIMPRTELSVSDKLTGLPTGADGSVTYTAYHSESDCTSGQNGVAAGGGAINGGVVPVSDTLQIGPQSDAFGPLVYWTATYSGNMGGFTTLCKESADSE